MASGKNFPETPGFFENDFGREAHMLRVCHLISGDLWAGAEVMAHNLLRRLQLLSYLDLSVVLLNEGRLAEELRAVGLPVHVLDEQRLSFAQLLREIRTFFRTRSPQVIHSHRYKENILAFFAGGLGRHARLVATQHGLPEPLSGCPGVSSRMAARLNRHLLARHFDRLVGVSRDVRKHFLQQTGFVAERVSVIHNGIELPGPAASNKSGILVVGSAGRLFPVKDYPLMVEIARVAAGKKPPLRFELAGEGPDWGRLEGLLAACGLGGSFVLRGYLPDMGEFYQGLDVYLNTSLHEGIPMSILEAMARGIPVVAPNVGGIREIIEDGVDGFLVPGRNPEDFAEKCLLLLNSELRQRMGLAARKKVEREFSAENMAQKYYQLYKDLAG
jgi:glycosyltransferase involved in cell wall biosynthesis